MKLLEKKQRAVAIKVLGLLLVIEAVFMFFSLIPALYYKQGDFLPIFYSFLITLSVGLVCRLACRNAGDDIDRRLGMVIVASIWIIMSAFGMLPYLFGGYIPDLASAVFETMSGFTTTGATILEDVESLPKGILFWRSLMHWIGGVGIVVIVISFIPFIGGGAMALFSAESAGPDKARISPHIGTTGKIICGVYFCLTALCCGAYCLCGMDFYDAINHAFSTLSSGGFSTKNASAAAFPPLVQYMMILFMIPAGTNFILIYYCVKGKFSYLGKSEEFRTYILAIVVCTLFVFAWILPQYESVEAAFRPALFQVVSLFTSTGFVTEDYTLWAKPAVLVLVLLGMSGAMSGSTSGGLKLVRVVLLFKNARLVIKRGVHSNAYLPLRLDGKIVQENVMNNVMTIFLLFVIMMTICIFILIFLGLNLEEAFGATVACITNAGPGLEDSGGFGNFAHLPSAAKWILSTAMYFGRLEIVTVLVVFMPSFWKR